MRIAFISLEYPPQNIGGAGIYLIRSIQELARLGHDVHVFTMNNNHTYNFQIEENINVHRLPVFNLSSLKTLSFWAVLTFFFRKINAQVLGFDVVHSNGISDFSLSKFFAPQLRVVTIHHLIQSHINVVHPSLMQRILQPGSELGIVSLLEPVCVHRANHIIAVSEFTKSELISQYKINPKRIEVILHGANPCDYQFTCEEINELKSGVRIEGAMLLSAGRLEPRKGIDILLRAFAEVLRKNKAVLVITGEGNRAFYNSLAQQLGIEEQIRFVGYVDPITLRKMFAACDLFVFPSLMEGLGIVALEARAAGKFIVASDVGGIPEVVPPGAGYLVPPGNVKLLAEAISLALNSNVFTKTSVRTWSDVGTQLSIFYRRIK